MVFPNPPPPTQKKSGQIMLPPTHFNSNKNMSPKRSPSHRHPLKPWPPKRCAVKTVAIEVLVRDIRGLSFFWGTCQDSNKLIQVIVLFRPKWPCNQSQHHFLEALGWQRWVVQSCHCDGAIPLTLFAAPCPFIPFNGVGTEILKA